MFRETHLQGAHHDDTLEALKYPNYLYTGYWMTSTVGRDGATCELAPSLFLKSSGDVSEMLMGLIVQVILVAPLFDVSRIGSSDQAMPFLLPVMTLSLERLLSTSSTSLVQVCVITYPSGYPNVVCSRPI